MWILTQLPKTDQSFFFFKPFVVTRTLTSCNFHKFDFLIFKYGGRILLSHKSSLGYKMKNKASTGFTTQNVNISFSNNIFHEKH